jgi:cytochrome c
MKIFIQFIFIGSIFIGCAEEKHYTQDQSKKLLINKCGQCHNLDIPPKIPKDEKAPPMMALVFHIKDILSKNSVDSVSSRFREFIVDFSINPAMDKVLCDQGTVKKYNLMPSLKDKITKDELKAIANYIYKLYDADKFFKLQTERQIFNNLPKGKQLAISNGCFSCHNESKNKVGPSFQLIANTSSKEQIKFSIIHGSNSKYKTSRSAMPPLGKHINPKDIDIIVDWIKGEL